MLREKIAEVVANNVHFEKEDKPCKDCYVLADQILGLFLSPEEVEKIISKFWKDTALGKSFNMDKVYTKLLAQALSGIPNFTAEELDAILPKKKMHPLNCVGECNCPSANYNKGISDCKQALLGGTE